MATSSINVTPGDGTKKAATHSFSEDAVTKELQRIVSSTPAGVDQTFAAGAVSAGTPRFTLASDDPLVVAMGLLAAAIDTLQRATPLDTKLIDPETDLDLEYDDVGALLGAEDATPAPNPTASAGLNGVLRGLWTSLLPTSAIGHGVKVVTTAGTDVVLAASTAVKWVTIQSQTDNTGKIAVGATGVDATVATGTGVLLNAGDTVTMPIANLASVFIDSTVSGDGVRYTYGT